MKELPGPYKHVKRALDPRRIMDFTLRGRNVRCVHIYNRLRSLYTLLIRH